MAGVLNGLAHPALKIFDSHLANLAEITAGAEMAAFAHQGVASVGVGEAVGQARFGDGGFKRLCFGVV